MGTRYLLVIPSLVVIAGVVGLTERVVRVVRLLIVRLGGLCVLVSSSQEGSSGASESSFGEEVLSLLTTRSRGSVSFEREKSLASGSRVGLTS